MIVLTSTVTFSNAGQAGSPRLSVPLSRKKLSWLLLLLLSWLWLLLLCPSNSSISLYILTSLIRTLPP